MNSRPKSLSSRIQSFFQFKSQVVSSRKRSTRQAQLEQLEARRVMAAAILEELTLDYSTAENSSLVRSGEGEGGGGSTPAKVFYYSPSVAGFVKNSNNSKLYVDDSDIVKLQVFSNGSWTHQIYFDGSDVGLASDSENVDAFSIRPDGSLLFSTVGLVGVPGASGNGEDLLRFRPTKLGDTTTGTWEVFFDGSDVGLSTWEGLDGVSELPDGRLILSVGRQAEVNGLSGRFHGEDLLSFKITTSGSNTSGVWAPFFDGSDVHLDGALENVDGVSVDSDGNTIHLSTTGLVRVPGLIGFGRDIFTFEASQLGSQTVGVYDTPLTLNGSHRGLLCNSINAIHIPSSTVVNLPPIIASITSPTIPEQALFSRQLSATDPDTPVAQLAWSIVSGPSGAQIGASTGLFTWTPIESQGPGVFPVIVAVTDGTSTAQATFSISVTEVNQPPVLAAISNQTIDERALLTVQVSASDADLPAQTLTYSIGAGAPAGASINSSGSFTWTPTEANGPGVFTVPIVVTDALGATATRSFTITVREVNQPPVIAAIANQTIDESTPLTVQVSASDADLPAQTVTYSLGAGAPAGASINSSGSFSWTPTETNGPGVFTVPIVVTDALGATATGSFTVTVREVNQPPVLAPISNQSVTVNQLLSVTAQATDPDLPANSLTYSLTTAPLSATINAQTGQISWLANTTGNSMFTVQVADQGGLTSSQTFQVTVDGVELRELDDFLAEYVQTLTVPNASSSLRIDFQSPTFDTTSQQAIRDAFEIELMDLSGNPLVLPYSGHSDASYNVTEGLSPVAALGVVTTNGGVGGAASATINLSGLAAGTQFQARMRLVNNDSDNGTIVRINNVAFVNETSARPLGISFNEVVQELQSVDFSKLEDVTGSFQVAYGRSTLAAANNRLLVDVQLQNRNTQSYRGPVLMVIKNLSSLDANALRPDGFTPAGEPYFQIGLSGEVISTGQSSISRRIGFLNSSNERFDYEVQILAAVNSAPNGFVSSPLSSIEAGDVYSYTAKATDPEGDVITYSMVSGPSTATINASTGALSWSTGSSDVGSQRFTIRATDPIGAYLEQTFTVQVFATLQNRPPNFVSNPVTDAIASSGFEVTTVATGTEPAGVVVIGGFRGPRLVSINAGDQSVSVHAGQNNDRFDDKTVYSTGEPKPTGAVIDAGYTVDVGLPPFLVPADRNEVLGMDQGDLNGDGILDLVVMANRVESTQPAGQRNKLEITRMLGDGDGNFGIPTVIASIPSTSLTGSLNQAKLLTIADIDSDGRLDVVALQETTPRLVTVRGLGDGNFQPVVFTTLATSLNDYRLVDLDQDGNLDIVGRTASYVDLGWMRGAGDGTFAPFVRLSVGGGVTLLNVEDPSRPYDFSDIDGDGDIDIVNSENSGGNIVIWLNDGSENFSIGATIDPPGSRGAYALHVADFTGDGRLDIFTTSSFERVELFVRDATGLSFALQTGVDAYVYSGNLAGSDDSVDIDGDGDLDIILANNLDLAPVDPQVFVNDGTGQFKRTDYPIANFPGDILSSSTTNRDAVRGVMFGDYNRDGVIDISYMSSTWNLGYDHTGVGVRLGTRPGEFGSTRTIHRMATTNDREVHAADFNGDGKVDLLSLFTARMSLGNGDGTFQGSFPATTVSAPSSQGVGVIEDFNLDGIPDYVAARGDGNNIAKIYTAIGNGDGTFASTLGPVVPGMFYSYSDIRTADFNNDGYPDLIAKGGIEEFIDVYLNNPTNPGTFTRPFRAVVEVQGTLTLGFDFVIPTGDFDSDGNTDFVTVERAGGPSSGNPLKLQTFSGDGTGNFTVTQESFTFDEALFPGEYPFVLQSGDVNSDGLLDLVSFGNFGFIIHIGDGNGSFTSVDRYPIELISQQTKSGNLVDFNQDGHLDLVQYAQQENLSIRLGKGDGTFSEAQRFGGHGDGGILTFADFDNDGHQDLATAMGGFGNGDTGTGDVVFYYGTRNGLVNQLAVDLDGDGNEEVLGVNEANDRLKVFTGDNLDRLNRRNDLLTGRAPQAVSTGDLNRDGSLEIITANRTGRSISVFRGSLASGYTSSEILVGSAPIEVTTRDINGDGHTDVLVLDEVANAVWVLSGSASGVLSAPVAIALGDKPGRFTVADATGDGQLDAVITLPDSNRLMILPRIGVQPASAPIYVSLTSSPSDIQVTDLNADGNPDLATTLPGSNVLSVLYGRGNNQFARAQNISVGKEPTRVTLADADEDGRMDLIVANSGDDTASVIYNRFDPNEVYRYDSDAIDPDNDTLTYSIIDGPGGLIINSQTGALLWAASPDQVGEHSVTIAANDGRGGIATQSFKIDVQPARDNALPLIATEPNTKIGAGETFTYQATALDNDRDTLRYSLINAPAGATIEPTTGKVTWDARADMALSFAPHGNSSTGHVEIEAHPSLQPTSLTAEGWYNFTGLPASNGRSNIITSGPATTTGTSYTLYNFGNTSLRLEVDYPSPTATFTYTIPYVPTANRWTHFAITIDDSTRAAKIYVDGVERGSTTLPAPLVYNPTQNYRVGDSRVFFTRAIIDNYRLWNVVRTPAEIVEGLSRQYNGDTRLVLDYRFDEPQTLTVRDFSPAGNHGYRVANGLLPAFVPGLAETGSHQFTIGVEDGRGGSDQQSFTLDILAELRGTIRGQAFSDSDNNGLRNGTEPVMAGVHLFIDANGNGYPDPSETQTTTAANGTYQFNGLLPGQYAVRVSSLAGFEAPTLSNVSVTTNTNSVVDLAMEQLALGQIRGQLRTEDLDAIAYWKVFADLDNDGELDAGEPMTTSDRGGNFALSGLSAGNYTVRAELPAGWSVATGTNGQNVTLAANAISTGNNFTLKPNNTSVTGGLHFVTTPTLTLEARQTFRYASVAIGINPEAISYDLSLAPEGVSIDPATGLIAWRPTIAQVGEHLVVVRATSASGSIALQDFTLTVNAPNTAPTLTTDLPSTAYVGLIYAVDLAAQDAESQTIAYSLLSGPSSATLNATTGQLRWTPTLANVGNATFSIELRDSAGGVRIVNATVAVVNAQPAATPFNVTLPRTQVGLGQDYFARIRGTDALGRPLTWSLVTGPAGLLVSSNGTLTWTPGNDDVGSHPIVLQATNVAGTSANSSFTLQVAGRPVNTAPVVTSTPIISTTLGKQYQYAVEVIDSDADPLSFALINAPIGMSIDPSLGTILWTPAADQLGESDVSVQVTDPDGSTATQEFKIKVSKSGGPPAITSVPPTEASVGTGYLYSIAAGDAEGDPLIFRLLAAPAGMTIAQTTGVIAWTPQASQVGQQDVVIEVSDGIGGAVTQAFAIRVSTGVPNLPPVISSTAPRFGAVGTAYSYTMQATDPEATTITYSLGQAPVGMTINASSGVVAWTPTAGQIGRFVVTLIATDAGGAKAVESFELDVLAANSQPTIISTAPLDVAAGAVFTYQVLGRDTDLDQLTYHLTTAPAGATIDSFGKITWSTTPALIGPHNFAVRVSDPRGGVATQSFTLSVIADLIPPKVSLVESLGDANRNILPWQGPFIVYVRAIDNVAVRSLTLKANGQDIPLDAAGTATFTFEDWGFQSINATATAVDTNGNITTRTINFDYDFPEGWSGAGTADIPTVSIASPTDTAAVFGIVTITGTASHANFAGYKLSYRRIDETTFTQFFESTTAVVNGTLGVWDTSLLINDEYIIRLEAATNAGVVNVVEHNVGLSGELKLGNFQLSFADMSIPVAGIPLTIARTYDTLQADRKGDFGYGWRLEFRNTDLRVGLPKSGLEDIGIYSPLRSGVKVYLNVPGQGRQGFTFNPEVRVLPGFGSNNNLTLARPRFTPDRGVTSTLSTGTSSYLLVNEFGELFAPGGIPYNPASPDFGGAYVLTSKEGVTYRINGSDGKLSTVRDLNGNTLTFTEAGITGTGGTAVAIERDAMNRITAVIDPLGNAVRYAYSTSGDLIRVTDREGHATNFGYRTDREHYLETVIDPLGRTGVRSEYDANGRLTGAIDGDGDRSSINYDPNNDLVTTRDGLNRPTTIEYDEFGNVVATTDALGNTTRRTYNAVGDTLSITDPLGRTTRMTYDSARNMTSMSNPFGQTMRMTYDSAGRVLSAVDPLGGSTINVYDSRGNLIRTTDATGGITTQIISARGEILSTTDPLGRTSSYAFNNRGVLTEIVTPEGQKTVYVVNAVGDATQFSLAPVGGGPIETTTVGYDRNSNMTALTGPDGESISLGYDAAGQVNSTTNSAGGRTLVSYTNDGRQSGAVLPGGSSANLTFDAAGQEVQANLPGGVQVQYEYDAVGRRTAVILPNGTRLDLNYDAAGQQTGGSASGGSNSQREYDAAGRLVRQTSPDGVTVRYEYDALGRTSAEIDGLGNRVTYSYDALGRLTGAVLPTGKVLVAAYDAAGNRTRRTDSSGGIWTYTYADDNSPLTATDPLGNTYTFRREGFGRNSGITDPLGRTTTFGYDSAGRLLTCSTALGFTTSYGYDADGRRNTLTDSLGRAYTSTFDADGNVIGLSTPDGLYATRFDVSNRPFEFTTPDGISRITYDAVGIVTSRTDADGSVVNYTTAANSRPTSVETSHGVTTRGISDGGRLQSVTDPAGGVTTMNYDAAGRPIRVNYPGGLTANATLDSIGRTTSIVYTGTTGGWGATYTRNINGQITAIDEGGRRIEYVYDVAGRLTSSTTIVGGQSNVTEYTYDAAGNVTGVQDASGNRPFVVDADDRLVSDGTWTYTYDAVGRMTSRTRSGQTDQYFFDAFDRLIRVERTGVVTSTIIYKYHADGLLAERREGSAIVKFVWDRGVALPQLLEERDGNGALLRRYESDGVRITHYRDAAGNLFVYALDQIDSVRAVLSPNGSIVAEYQYDAFGRPLASTPAGMGYGGSWSDPATGMVFLRTRWYQPESARFITRDSAAPNPADPSRTVNRYAYVANDPVNRVDPSGQTGLLADVLKTLGIQSVIFSVGLSAFVAKSVEKAGGIGGLSKAFAGAADSWWYSGLSLSAVLSYSKAFVGAAGGFEVFRHRSSETGLFFVFGFSLNASEGGFGGSVTGSAVYDTNNVSNYSGWFWTATLPIGALNFLAKKLINKTLPFSKNISLAFSPTPTFYGSPTDFFDQLRDKPSAASQSSTSGLPARFSHTVGLNFSGSFELSASVVLYIPLAISGDADAFTVIREADWF